MWLITTTSWKSSLMELMVSTTRLSPRVSCEPKPSSMISVCSCAPARRASSLLSAMRRARFAAKSLAPGEELVGPRSQLVPDDDVERLRHAAGDLFALRLQAHVHPAFAHSLEQPVCLHLDLGYGALDDHRLDALLAEGLAQLRVSADLDVERIQLLDAATRGAPRAGPTRPAAAVPRPAAAVRGGWPGPRPAPAHLPA